MIKLGISEKAVSIARAEAEAAEKESQRITDAWLELPREDRAADYSEVATADQKRKEACDIAQAMKTARRHQIENVMRRAISEHASELDGKPAHYKRTASLIKSIVSNALQVDESDVSAWNTYHFSFKITCLGAELELYVGNGEFEAESVRNWARPKDDGRDDLTPAKVRRLVAQRSKEERRLKEAAEAHKERARKAIDKFACIGDTKRLKDAAKVEYI